MGMVRQWQELTYESRYSESYSSALPDFVALAEAYGWKGLRVNDPANLDDTIQEMIDYNGPVIVDCHIAKLENCFPMVPAGAAHNEMMLAGDVQSKPKNDEALAVV
jgi:acetolactate synthase-1/2/3 large subunit